MRKIISMLAFFLVGMAQIAVAQSSIRGRVTESDGDPISGASVKVQGTNRGTVTDNNGNFGITVNSGDNVEITAVGFVKAVVAAEAGMVVKLNRENKAINEVVVTALNIKRDKKSVGFASQNVKAADLTEAKEVNLLNSLSGKVAGLQVTGSGNIGGSSRIILRGIKSLTGENQPLIVVDGVPINNSNFTSTDQARGGLGYDYGNAAQDINPDDIENITVLKGATASALYGNRGANGVILITTKKGSRKKGTGRQPLGISYNTTVQLSNVLFTPNYQNEYGGGSLDTFRFSALYPGERRVQFGYDGSWGPKLDGQPVHQWLSYYPGTPNFGKATPWTANPNNIDDFYVTGVTTNNNIAFENGNENGNYRISYTNLNQTGVIENSRVTRNVLNFGSTYKLNAKLTSGFSANYIASNAKGRPQTGYSNLSSNFTQWWQRQLDMDELKEWYLKPDGTQRSWNRTSEANETPLYWDNPYFTIYKNYQNDKRNRIFGNAFLSYDILPWLTAKGTVMTDYYNEIREERGSQGTRTANFWFGTEGYMQNNISFNENNYEFLLTAKKDITSDLDVTVIGGTNRRDASTRNNLSATQGGLNVPNFFILENSVDKPFTNNNLQRQRINSLFGSASFGYKKMLFLDLTGRNDWNSTLYNTADPSLSNFSYFYPSVSSSFIFSDLIKAKALSFGKLRASWASVANGTNPYSLETRYTPNSAGANGNSVYVLPGSANNPSLRPEYVNTFEVGTELMFFKDRLRLDVTRYSSLTKDAIFNVAQSGASGFTSRTVNAGTMANRGWEVSSTFIPVRLKNSFEWSVGLNYARNRNEVVELYKDENGEEVKSLRLATAPFAVYIEARPGEAYGQIVGTDFYRDANGNKIVDADGFYIPTAELKSLGSILPNFTGGVSNSFAYKRFRLYGLVDFSQGGKLFSLNNVWGKYSGTLAETAEGGIRENGIIVDGVKQTGTDANGTPISNGTPNDVKIAAVDHFFNNQGYVIAAADVYDASFVKLRELRLNYDLPIAKISKKLTGLSLGISGRNLAILYKNVPHIDPEAAVSAGNVQGLEGGQLPTVRTWGLNLNVKF